MKWVERHKILVGAAGAIFLSYILLLMGVEQASVVFTLAGIVAVAWVVWILLCVIFPVLKRKKGVKSNK